MKTRVLTFLLGLLLATPGMRAERVGLVLSGGGAKGIAHIGVIRALEENNIPIDYVTGTSMGAIVGGMYAAGYSPAEMMTLITSPDFAYWSTGTIDPALRYQFTTPPESPKLISLSVGNDSVAKLVPQSLIGPLAQNFPFMEIFAAQTAASHGDFNRLFVPLRTVSSNIEAQRAVVARSGSLTDAIRSSMSFPIVFCPVEINDTLHYDGGLFDNFPVDVMRTDFHPDVIIGVDVHNPSSNPDYSIISQISNLATRPQSYALPANEGVKIAIDLTRYSLLDFPQAREIYAIGYQRGLEMVDSIKARIKARRTQADVDSRRQAYKATLRPLKFDRVVCTGGTPTQNEYIRDQFPNDGHHINLSEARHGYYRAISSELLQDLKVRVDSAPQDGRMQLLLKAYPKSPWSIDLGGYITSSTSSMLYGALNFATLKQHSLNASLATWFGQSYQAAQLLSDIRLGRYSLGLQGVVSRHNFNQSERLFFNFHQPRFVKVFEAFGRATLLSTPLGIHATAKLQVGYGTYVSSFFNPAGMEMRRRHNLGQAILRYDYNTLNAINYPTNGLEIKSSAMGLYGGNEKWVQFYGRFRWYELLSKKFAIGFSSELLASTRHAPLNYDVALADAPSYKPTPSCFNAYNPSFHAYSFLGFGVEPVWTIINNVQVRPFLSLFMPWHRIGESRTLPGAEFFGELALNYSFKSVTVSAYTNYRTGNDAERGFHGGLSLGIFLPAPSFLQ